MEMLFILELTVPIQKIKYRKDHNSFNYGNKTMGLYLY